MTYNTPFSLTGLKTQLNFQIYSPTPNVVAAVGKQRLLNLFASMKGVHTLSGQVMLANSPTQADGLPKDQDMWNAINGLKVFPGLFGCNIYGNSGTFSNYWVNQAIAYAQGGPVGTLQAVILVDCATPASVGNNTSSSWLTSGSAANNAINAILSQMASVISTFKANKIPVCFRPWHEMSGNWAWYGVGGPAGATAAQLAALWQYTWNYMQAQGLNDYIVWVWSPNHDGLLISGLYPGDAYVDVVGFDTYGDPVPADGYTAAATVALTKYRAFGEYGQNLTSNTTSYSFQSLIGQINSTFPEVLWWMSWDGGASNNGDGWSLAQSTDPFFSLYTFGKPRLLNRGDVSY